MKNGSEKCVMVLSEGLPAGLAVNTAGVLAFTLGRKLEEVVGPEVVDGSGRTHLGITRIPIPILKADETVVRNIREQAERTDGMVVVDFTDAAQTSKTYEEYQQKMATRTSEELRYLGVALYGDKKLVNRLTGSLPLLR
jgi:hypothetical protein